MTADSLQKQDQGPGGRLFQKGDQHAALRPMGGGDTEDQAKLAVETMPSLAPRTAARSHLLGPVAAARGVLESGYALAASGSPRRSARAAAMNLSRSPLSTPPVSLVSTPVRRSFTI
jgi:hypothetical protein